MNTKSIVFSIITAGLLCSCDNETSNLGSTLVPADDNINVKADSCFAYSRSIKSSDSLLILSNQCNLGCYTDANTGTTLHASFLTQLNCNENLELPDSIYGIGNFSFPEWFKQEMADTKPYYAEFRLYYSKWFGDSTNTVKIELFPLNKMLDGNKKYYPDLDPAEFCDLSKPLGSATVSAWNLQNSDSLRNTKNYYPYITVPLPDSLAKRILETYYQPDGKQKFADAPTFMSNILKGFYIRCTQGDGTVFYIDNTVLRIIFKTISFEDATKVGSYVVEFLGNEEVMQLNNFKWSGLEKQLDDNSCTWIRTPFGILTEITLPIDSMKDQNSVLNSAQICLSSANTPSTRFKPSVPSSVILIRKSILESFFSKNNLTDNVESFAATYSTKYGTYTFDNIAALVEKAFSERKEWLEKHTDKDTDDYQNEYPDWNKVVIIPVTAQTNSQRTVISYSIDINLHEVKLIGGTRNKIKIKTIRSRF